MENKRKTPGPLAAAFLHRIGLPIPTPGQDACGGWLGQETDPRNPASTRPQPDGTPSVPASTNRTFFEIRVACPSLPLQGGGACWGAGGTHLDRGPPAASQSARLRSSPPLSANLIRESGQGIGAAYLAVVFFGRAFPRWSVPGHPPLPPSSSITSSTPPLGPKSCTSHLAHHHPPGGAPHPLHNPSMHPCTGCDRGTDSVWLSASHIRHRRRPSPSIPPSSPRPPASGHGWAHPSSTANPGKDILQSAICNLRPPADTGQRGNHLNGPTSYHIGTAAGCVAFADLASSTL